MREWVTGGGWSHFQGWERKFWEMLLISSNSFINGKVNLFRWHFLILCLCSLLQIWVVNMEWLKKKKNKILWILSLFQTRNISSHRFNNNHQDKAIYYESRSGIKLEKDELWTESLGGEPLCQAFRDKQPWIQAIP